jgi:hypothetical protein
MLNIRATFTGELPNFASSFVHHHLESVILNIIPTLSVAISEKTKIRTATPQFVQDIESHFCLRFYDFTAVKSPTIRYPLKWKSDHIVIR